MDGCGKPQNLNNVAIVRCRILQTGSQNSTKFAVANCGSYTCTVSS